MNTVYLLLGSNEGDRVCWLQMAVEALAGSCGSIQQVSSLYETAAWGLTDQPDFLNLAVCLHSDLDARTLLRHIQEIEQQLGRQRTVKWGQRTLDIDILFFNDEIIDIPELKIPHPHLRERRFALQPLSEIAARLVHPVLLQPVNDLLASCPDPLPVWRFPAATVPA